MKGAFFCQVFLGVFFGQDVFCCVFFVAVFLLREVLSAPLSLKPNPWNEKKRHKLDNHGGATHYVTT